MRLLKIYLRTIDKQFINKQPSYIQEILECFLDDKNNHDKILCRGKKSNETAEIEIQLATDPRFSTALTTLLNKEDPRGCEIDDIMAMYKYPAEYVVELIKKDDEKYNSYLELFTEGNRHALISVNATIEDCHLISANDDNSKNVILYGVPGCGKSFTIARDYCDDKNYMERIVFHPDYSYADFVGQILPSNVGGQISYPFKPGPFTRMLKKANEDPNNNYYLIIEEINRGNAPAIFGDIFQLLDRTDEGISVYPISNEDIAKEACGGDANAEIKLPSNLYILATMNTADQNVFTLDTAFKRRWRFKSIENNVDECDFANRQILDTKVSWKEFVKKINSAIIAQSKSSIGNEDKRLGAWFIKEADLSNKEQFGSKILMYLWNDVFKYNPEDIFNIELLEEKTLDCLIKKFNEVEFEIFNKNNINFVQSNFTTNNRVDVTDELLEKYNPIGVGIYKKIVAELKTKIPSFKDIYFTNSDYFQFQADDIKRAGFVDIGMTKRINRIQINIELPSEEKQNEFINNEIGSIPGGNKWSHKFLIELQNENDLTDDVINAIYNSYETLKQ